MLSPILGHASGFSWDEALLVMAPIAIVAGVLFLANQRAKRLGSADTYAATTDPVTDPVDPASDPTSDPAIEVTPNEVEDPPVSRP